MFYIENDVFLEYLRREIDLLYLGNCYHKAARTLARKQDLEYVKNYGAENCT